MARPNEPTYAEVNQDVLDTLMYTGKGYWILLCSCIVVVIVCFIGPWIYQLEVGVGAAGVEWLKTGGKPTLYIAGNHEYYGGDITTVQQDIQAAVAGTEIVFLECESAEFDGVRFLGATFWTNFMGENEKLMETLKQQMNDYQQISYQGRDLAPDDLAAINRESSAWLEEELARGYDGKTVVLTHHAPLFASWRSSMNSIFKGAYCNNLTRLIIDYPIDLWIHGHVHDS